jgi:hypothetical protein
MPTFITTLFRTTIFNVHHVHETEIKKPIPFIGLSLRIMFDEVLTIWRDIGSGCSSCRGRHDAHDSTSKRIKSRCTKLFGQAKLEERKKDGAKEGSRSIYNFSIVM